jgi:hypothetical protein
MPIGGVQFKSRIQESECRKQKVEEQTDLSTGERVARDSAFTSRSGPGEGSVRRDSGLDPWILTADS